MSNPVALFRTTTIRVDDAASFISQFYPQGGATTLDNHLYATIGREDNPVGNNPDTGAAWATSAGTWSADPTPDPAIDTLFGDALFWSMCIGGQHISNADIAPMVPMLSTTRWTTGTAYSAYDYKSTNQYVTNNFYVVNSSNEVFIRVATPTTSGVTQPTATSTVEPNFWTIYSNGATLAQVLFDEPTTTQGAHSAVYNYFGDAKQCIIVTADGYTWKYLYTLPAHSVNNLVQTNWLPVNFGSQAGTAPGNVWTINDGRYTQSQDNVGLYGNANRILGARFVLVRALLAASVNAASSLPSGLRYRQIALLKNAKDSAGTRAVAAYMVQPNSLMSTGGMAQDGTASQIFTINTGEVLYIENKPPITRTTAQTEETKLIVSF